MSLATIQFLSDQQYSAVPETPFDTYCGPQIIRRTQIFFLLNLYLKHGISSVYVMVDFICKGYLEMWGTQVERKLQNEKILPNVGFEPGTFRFQCQIRTLNFVPFPHDISITFWHTIMILHTRVDHDPRRTTIDLMVNRRNVKVKFGLRTSNFEISAQEL